MSTAARPPVRLVQLRIGRDETPRSPSSPLTPTAPITIELGAARIAIPSGSDGPTVRLVIETLAGALGGGRR